MTFAERLENLLKERKISKAKLLADLKLGKNQFNYWKKNNSVPNGFTVQNIAEYLDTSVDYLLGRSDLLTDDKKGNLYSIEIMSPPTDEKTNDIFTDMEGINTAENAFWINFVNLCNEHNIKPNPLAKKLGFSSGNVTAWKNGRIPKWTNLQKIADYFQVNVKDLISSPHILIQSENGNSYIIEAMAPTDQKEKTAETDSHSLLEQEFLKECSTLSEEELNSVRRYIQFLISERNQ